MPKECQTMKWELYKGDPAWRFWLVLPDCFPEMLFLCTEPNQPLYYFQYYRRNNPKGVDYDT